MSLGERMTVDPDRMAEIAEETYVGAVLNGFGESGAKSLRATLTTIRKLYEHVPPEIVNGALVVVCPVSDAAGVSGIVRDRETGNGVRSTVVTRLEHLAAEFEPRGQPTINVLEITHGSQFRFFSDVAVPDYRALSQHSIVYVLDGSRETFYMAGDVREVVNPTRGVHASVYAIPTFRALEDALEDYRLRFVRYCGCRILAKVWESDARLIFKNKPEATMRRSMAQFLRMTLRGAATIGEEKTVDESHPVDVRVTWQLGTRVALIEIKWIGDSRTRTGKLLKYRDSRANEGAQQLLEYLEAEAAQTPTHYRTGYLVVIDGRRRAVRRDTEALTLKDARYYANRPVVYKPLYHRPQAEFSVPLRMFIEPNKSKCIQP